MAGAIATWMNFNGEIAGRARVDAPDWSRTNIALERHELDIHDARPIADSLSLDREGFLLARHACEPIGTAAGEAEKHGYLASVAAFLRALSGADLVVPQGKGLLIRHAESARRAGAPGPSRWVHMDYTPDAARKWSGWMADWEDIPKDRYSRFAIFQTWRCLTPPPCDNTLALCDASSIRSGDCIPFDACVATPYDAPGNQFESQLGKYDAGQRWYYFSDLEADEMIVFKGFDSAPGWCAQPMHNSIDLPDADGRAAPRASIEARFFAYFA